ncbi:MAG: DUF2239 family protein [Pseudomonadota bacterium]|nr:DUF2239 family protein [Pseudomonadota bacterium]
MSWYVAFDGARRIASGDRREVALALKRCESGSLLAFEMASGAQVDFDLRGAEAEVAERYSDSERGRGRPKLGVIAREVTLLPRHWDWLARQRGGASAALRRLVDAARAADQGATDAAAAREAAYRFLSAIAGDRPHFEEAARALFAGDLARLRALSADWPTDIVDVAFARLEAGEGALSA